MATAAATAAPEAAPKKKKGKKLVLVLALLILVGAGAGAGLYFSGLLGPSHEEGAEPAKDLPKLLAKGSKPKAEEGEKASSAEAPKYESSYFQIEKEFTSNLKDSSHLIQIGLAVSTPYDEKVIENLKTHEIAVRSAVLLTLGETAEDAVFTTDGKEALQQRLVASINRVLKQKEGFGGVSNVYFTNFVVQ